MSVAARPSAEPPVLEVASFSALGSAFEVGTDIAGLAEAVDHLFEPWATLSPSGPMGIEDM